MPLDDWRAGLLASLDHFVASVYQPGRTNPYFNAAGLRPIAPQLLPRAMVGLSAGSLFEANGAQALGPSIGQPGSHFDTPPHWLFAHCPPAPSEKSVRFKLSDWGRPEIDGRGSPP
jgi:hypothetical protein